MSEVGDRKIHGAEIVLKNWSELRCKFLLLLNQHLLSFAMRTHDYEITVEYIFQYSFSFFSFLFFIHMNLRNYETSIAFWDIWHIYMTETYILNGRSKFCQT